MSTTDISKELDEMFREYFLEVMRGAVEQDGETIAVFAERTKKIRQKFIASTEALIDRVTEQSYKKGYIDAENDCTKVRESILARLSNTTGEGK